jgi:hypothetical protein
VKLKGKVPEIWKGKEKEYHELCRVIEQLEEEQLEHQQGRKN